MKNALKTHLQNSRCAKKSRRACKNHVGAFKIIEALIKSPRHLKKHSGAQKVTWVLEKNSSSSADPACAEK